MDSRQEERIEALHTIKVKVERFNAFIGNKVNPVLIGISCAASLIVFLISVLFYLTGDL